MSYQRLVRGLKVGICTVGFQEKCENKLVVTEITTSVERQKRTVGFASGFRVLENRGAR